MAKRIKGITIEIDGSTTGLEKSLDGVNKKTGKVATELRDVERLLKFNPKNTELLEQKQKLLGEQIGNTKDKLDKLKGAQEAVNQEFEAGNIGEDQYRGFKREIEETESKLGNLEGKLKDVTTTADRSSQKLEAAGTKLKNVGDKLTGVGKGLTAGVTAPLAAGVGLVVEGTAELRGDLAKLDQNAESAGVSADVMRDALTNLSGVSEETDSNIEALSNLLATGFDEQGMLGAMDALAGAVIKFPDTLNIEGLADGLQETLATGAATGSFAEMLERMGVDLDVFNEGLETAALNGDEQNYVMQTLADTGLADVNQAFRDNNEELINSRESSMEFQESMAKLGETLAPIITKITELATSLIDWFNDLSPATQDMILVIGAIVMAIGPLLIVIGQIALGFGGIMTVLSGTSITLLGVLGPLAAIVVGIIAVIQIVKNWDAIMEWFGQTFAGIWDGITNAWEGIKTDFSDGFETIKGMVERGVQKLKDLFDFEWSLPNIKLPHFSMTGNFSLNPPSIPKIDVDWYKAGGILTKPTIFGANGSSLMAGGEAGPEAVLPLNAETLGGIGKGIADAMGGFNNRNQTIVVRPELNGKLIAQEIYIHIDQAGGASMRNNKRRLAR